MQQTTSDEWVLQRLEGWRLRRDGEALGELLKWQRDHSYATAFRILQQGADAEDVVQQAFLKILSRTQGFESVVAFRNAVYRSVVQCALDMARAKRVQSRLEKAMNCIETRRNEETARPKDEESLAAAWQELAALNEEQRTMVMLCCQEGLTISDASEVLSIPRETLRDRLKSTLEELRSRLNARGITVSLILLSLIFKQGSAQAAPLALCEALDVILPGEPCSMLPSAGPVDVALHGIHSDAQTVHTGYSGILNGFWRVRLAAALLLVSLSALWLNNSITTSALRDPPAPKLVASASNVPAEVDRAANSKPSPVPDKVSAPPRKIRKDEILTADVSPEVLAAAKRCVPGIKFTQIKWKFEDGIQIYEFKGRAENGAFEIKLTPDGRLLELDKDDEGDEDDATQKANENKKALGNPGEF